MNEKTSNKKNEHSFYVCVNHTIATDDHQMISQKKRKLNNYSLFCSFSRILYSEDLFSHL